MKNNLLYLLAVAFLVSGLAFVNRYPFVYDDTGSYIRSAWELKAMEDRPIGYGLFIRAVTWKSTLWPVVIVQGLLIAWLLFEVLKQFLPKGTCTWRVHLLLVATLMLCSTMPWYAAQLMPDVFAAMIPLVLFLLIHGRDISMLRRGLMWVCLPMMLMTHYSYCAMAMLLLIGAAVLGLLRKGKERPPRFWSNWSGGVLALVFSIGFVTWHNAMSGFRPVFSPSANVFFTGRLCQGDVLGSFLRAHCDEHAYPVCPYMDELPTIPGNFIWPENSITNKMHMSMAQADTALAPMVHDVLTDPGSLSAYLGSVLVTTVSQLFQLDAGSGFGSYYVDSGPYVSVHEYVPEDVSYYITSLQAYNAWRFDVVSRVVIMALLVSVLVIAWCWPRKEVDARPRRFARLLLVWVVLNAAVTGGLANVYDRLQGRVTWLVVLVACVLLLRTAWAQRLMLRYAKDGA